jgi:choline dehydrogenase-like flavoprotein
MEINVNNPYSKQNKENKNWLHLKGSELDSDLAILCDVVIVGTGAGGAVTAEILAAAGLNVVMVEEGPLRHSEHFKMQEKIAYADLYQEGASRKTLDKAINIMQGRSVGGSTTVNWTSSFRTPTQTLEYWQKEHNVVGLTEQSMAPWFAKMEQRLNIKPWTVQANNNNQKLQDGLSKLGWSSKVISRNVNGCANLGYCGMGCPINAKQSMLVSTIPSALNNGATLISRARVEKIDVINGKATGVSIQFLDSTGQLRNGLKGKVHGRHVVLSAGAIGTPAILLRSKIPDPYNLIGKRTFIHPVNLTAAIFDEKIEAFSGAPQSIYSDQFQWPADGTTGFKLEVPPMHPLLTSILMNGFGEKHASLMKQFPNLQSILALLRDGFDEENQGGEIKLDENDSPVLDYKITDNLWATFKKSYAVMMEIQFAAGAKKVMPLHRDAELVDSWKDAKKMLQDLPMKALRANLFTAHLMGGCSFGEDPKHAVVNSNLESHQLENLSVIDGSIFPTSLGVNPQLSIYAFSAKAATALVTKLKGGLTLTL